MHCVNAPGQSTMKILGFKMLTLCIYIGRPGFESLRRNFCSGEPYLLFPFIWRFCLLISFQFFAFIFIFFSFFFSFFCAKFKCDMTLVLRILFHKNFFLLLVTTTTRKKFEFSNQHHKKRRRRRRRRRTKRTLIRFFILESSPPS